jgi:hypothetical protein
MPWQTFKHIKDVRKSRFSKVIRSAITLNEATQLQVVFDIQIAQRRNTFEYHGDHQAIARWRWMKRKLKKLVASGVIPPEYNKLGSKVTRDFYSRNRYYYDSRLTSEDGWEQYDTDQDAWYFGVWVNLRERKTFSYVEGDLILVESPTQEIFIAELKQMAEFYEPARAFSTIDEDGTVTRHYCSRPGDDLIGFSIEEWVAKQQAQKEAVNA